MTHRVEECGLWRQTVNLVRPHLCLISFFVKWGYTIAVHLRVIVRVK